MFNICCGLDVRISRIWVGRENVRVYLDRSYIVWEGKFGDIEGGMRRLFFLDFGEVSFCGRRWVLWCGIGVNLRRGDIF